MSHSAASRRHFLRRGLATVLTGATAVLPRTGRAASAEPRRPICAFTKFLQDLDYDETARRVAAMGFDGIEATVRRGGHVLPERVEDDLPRMVEALARHGIDITIMASDVARADDPLSEKVLRTAAGLGIKRYRMGYYRYDLGREILPQLESLPPVVRDLAAMNRDLGLQALYQNHAGSRYVGATFWDLKRLLEDIDPRQIALAFDIRHATVEGGQAWPLYWKLMQPHLGAVYVKDFRWNGRDVKNVPLGQGQIDPAFFERLDDIGFRGPISLHVEYLEHAGAGPNSDALARDLTTLRKWLGTPLTT